MSLSLIHHIASTIPQPPSTSRAFRHRPRLLSLQTRRTRALPARNTLTDENAPTTRSRSTASVKPGVAATSTVAIKPSMSRTNSSASTVLAKKAATTTTSGKVGGLDAKQSTAGTSRVVVGSSKQQETGTRNRAALGELTNKDATNVTSGDQKAKSTGSKSTSTVTGRPIIARRVTRNSLAAADKPVVDGPVEPTAAGPSRSTITSTARARPAARTRPSAKNVNVKEDDPVAVAGTTKREPLTGKATSSTVNHARAGINRTLTASTVVQTVPPAQPVALERQTSVKREIDETHHGEEENPIQPSSKRIRTSSPVKRDDAELEREPEFEHEHGRLVDVEEEGFREKSELVMHLDEPVGKEPAHLPFEVRLLFHVFSVGHARVLRPQVNKVEQDQQRKCLMSRSHVGDSPRALSYS